MAIGLGCLAFGSLHMAKKGFLKDEEVERMAQINPLMWDGSWKAEL